MSRYRLSPLTPQDLADIRDYYWTLVAARAPRTMLVELVEAFRALARMPGTGHRREDLAGDRPCSFWPVRTYVVIYRATRRPMDIVTVVHGSRDIPTLLKRMNL